MGHYGALWSHYPKIAKTVIFACFGNFASFHKILKKAAGIMGHIRTCKLQASTHEMLKYGGTAGTLVPHPTILKLLTKAVCKFLQDLKQWLACSMGHYLNF